MNEQRIREIAERAFKRQFPDVKLARVNVWPGVGFEDDSPVVDVHIIYDGKYEQLNADGLLDAQGEVVDKAYCVHFFAKSDLGRRDLATV